MSSDAAAVAEAPTGSVRPAADGPRSRPRGRGFPLRGSATGAPISSLSARLLLMTVIFVLLAEVLIFIPSIAKYRRDRILTLITNVQIAALVHRERDEERRHDDLERNLMNRLGVLAVVLARPGSERVLLSSGETLPTPERTVDIGDTYRLDWIVEAFDGFLASNDRVLKIISNDSWDIGGRLIIYMHERQLRSAMFTYSGNIFWLSLVIAVLVSASVYATLYYVAVNPIRRIILSMIHFRERPEDASRIIRPKARGTELAEAEKALAELQTQVRASLQHKSRLAALGTAVTKINHDLRNILASSRLISERLAAIDDPSVRAMAPKLVAALDRATALCTNTLRFGRADEPPPALKLFALRDLACDVATMLDLHEQDRIAWRIEMDPGLEVYADPDHIFRVLLNLARNAVQAVESVSNGREARITLRARAQDGHTVVELEDTGPGIPERARARLFEAFVSTAREGGTGLGLAIASELVKANGGSIELARSDANGTVFRLTLPGREPA